MLGYRNLVDTAASIKATINGATQAGVTAVLTPQLEHAWTSPPTTSTAATYRVHVDLGASTSGLRLFVFALPRSVTPPTSPIFMRVFLDTTTEGGSNVLFGPDDTATILASAGYWVYLHPSDLTGRHITWRFTYDGTVDPTITTARVWAGPALVTARGVGTDLLQEYADSGIFERVGRAGLRLAATGRKYRRMSFTAPSLTAAEATTLAAAAEEVGTSGQVFCSPFAESRASMSTNGFFGHFTEVPQVDAVRRSGRYTAALALEEDV